MKKSKKSLVKYTICVPASQDIDFFYNNEGTPHALGERISSQLYWVDKDNIRQAVSNVGRDYGIVFVKLPSSLHVARFRVTLTAEEAVKLEHMLLLEDLSS